MYARKRDRRGCVKTDLVLMHPLSFVLNFAIAAKGFAP